MVWYELSNYVFCMTNICGKTNKKIGYDCKLTLKPFSIFAMVIHMKTLSCLDELTELAIDEEYMLKVIKKSYAC